MSLKGGYVRCHRFVGGVGVVEQDTQIDGVGEWVWCWLLSEDGSLCQLEMKRMMLQSGGEYPVSLACSAFVVCNT
ncbi:hypothetical protein QR685DRAFT_517299 [Neurospora intermedia]|uniref:Uncharacterized protein n=1 Tax=Neurospora intermedia TaxID=5142 RepID=A0ABR3DLR2_NEUIN